jgi:hypothetical protein
MTGEPFTFQSAVAATGTGNVMEFDRKFGRMLAVQITGTFTATVTFEGSTDGTNYVAVAGLNRSDHATFASAPPAAGQYLIDIGGFAKFRCRVTWSSGTSVTVIGTPFHG